MSQTHSPSRSAKILYRPFGIASSMAGGLAAGAIFKQVYKRIAPGDHESTPGPLATEYSLRQMLVSAAIQGAIYACVKALIDRGGARAFERFTGEWPGK